MAKIQRSNMTKKVNGKVVRAPKSSETVENYKWWDIDKKNEQELADCIVATIRQIHTAQSSRIEQLTISTRLYGSTSAYNLMGSAFVRTSNASPTSSRLSYNLCSSVIDTLESKMAKNNVIPTYITNGAVWANQKKAAQLTKFTQGLFHEAKMHGQTIEAFSDAAVWGDSFVYVHRTPEDKVGFEKDLPHEIWVDYVESTVSEPKQLHRVKIRDRDWALVHYPDMEDAIKSVSSAAYNEIGAQRTVADLIVVTESWRLNSSVDSKDGCYVVTIGNKAKKYDYHKTRFPFAHLRYAKRKLGWYGQGACERLQNIQGEVNRGMILKQRSLWMMGSFKVLLENGSKVVTQHLNNEVGTIIHYTGTEPKYVTPPATNPELNQWIDSLIQKGYDQEGVSRLSSIGETPMGVESGKAMRTLNQISDDRFLFTGQRLEEFNLDIASLAIDVVKDIFKDKKTYKVTFPQTNFMETVDWKEINLDDDAYWLKAYPTSSLSEDLTGRLSEVQEMMQAGLVSPRVGKRLMDMPDIEMADSLDSASYDLLCNKIEDMLFDKKPYSPEPFNDLALAKDLALKYFNYAQLHECPEENLNVLRNFLAQLDDLQKQAMIAAQPPVAPMANPQAAPQSNLIPNVNQQGAV